jgi:hypothetical protein
VFTNSTGGLTLFKNGILFFLFSPVNVTNVKPEGEPGDSSFKTDTGDDTTCIVDPALTHIVVLLSGKAVYIQMGVLFEKRYVVCYTLWRCVFIRSSRSLHTRCTLQTTCDLIVIPIGIPNWLAGAGSVDVGVGPSNAPPNLMQH